jgi:hypothetical protein
MSQTTAMSDEVVICLVCTEKGVEIRYADDDEAVTERTHQILAHLTLPMTSLKAALKRAFVETKQ